MLKLGYGITSIKGVYTENYKSPDAKSFKAESFLVVDLKDTGKLKSDLIKLGTEFDQDSITFSKKGPDGVYFIISTNTCKNGYPGKGKIGIILKLGKPLFGKSGQMHSKVNGRPFVFESAPIDIYKFSDLSIRSKTAIDIMANEPIDTACELMMEDINNV